MGLNLAIAIALHNIPEVQKSIIQLLSLNETNYLKFELLPPMIALECFCASVRFKWHFFLVLKLKKFHVQYECQILVVTFICAKLQINVYHGKSVHDDS